MLDPLDLREGVRLLGVGVSNFATSAQEELFVVDDEGRLLDEPEVTEEITPIQPGPFGRRRSFDGRNWPPGVDLIHDEYGRGWVWGSGRGIVTCRFEYRGSEIGRVKSVPQDDEALHPAHPLPLAWQPPQEDVPSE
jgi:DNA polymerase-4